MKCPKCGNEMEFLETVLLHGLVQNVKWFWLIVQKSR